MNFKRLYLFIVVLFIGFAIAHHSHNSFNEGKLVELNGTVVEYNYRNPHIEIILQVGTDDPATEEVEGEVWEIDTVSATGANRHKLYRDSIQEGDAIKVSGWPLSSGEPVMYGGKLVIFADREAALEANLSFVTEDAPEGIVVLEEVEGGKTEIPFDPAIVSADASATATATSTEEMPELQTWLFRQTLW